MDADVMRIPVKLFLASGKVIHSSLSYTREGPKIFNSNGSELQVPDSNVEFSIVDEALCESISIAQDDRITFWSPIFNRRMKLDSRGQYDLYPPSSDNWMTHLSNEGVDTTLAIQKISEGSRYLLSVVENSTQELVRFHTIYNYETSILQMETDWDSINRIFLKPKKGLMDVSIEDLLEAPAPSWSDIGKLVEGVDIPKL